MAAHAERATRSTEGPRNIRPRPARLEVKRNFFFNRVVESWNQIPSNVKNARNVGMFKRLYRTPRGPGLSSLDGERSGVQDGGMERQRTMTLPERPQRGYWQFLYNYTSKYTSISRIQIQIRNPNPPQNITYPEHCFVSQTSL
jgi:hypothetical protein